MTVVSEESNRGPLLNIASWFTTIIMCIAVGVKLYTRWAMTRNLHFDDFLIISAMVSGGRSLDASAHL